MLNSDLIFIQGGIYEYSSRCRIFLRRLFFLTCLKEYFVVIICNGKLEIQDFVLCKMMIIFLLVKMP